jgi:hypothetical protein
MGQAVPQTLHNHVRFDPLFHFFLLPVFLISWLLSVYFAIRSPSLLSIWGIVFVTAVIVTGLKARLYALKVQDRVIRLEERLRLASILPAPLNSQIPKLSEKQLVGLRFASDEEIAALAQRTLAENLAPADIKKAIRNWRADYWRV